jgi:hypothetical protein
LLGVAVSAWQAIRATHAEQLAVTARDAEVAERMEAEQQRDRALKAESETKAQRDRALKAEADATTAAKLANEEKAIAEAVTARPITGDPSDRPPAVSVRLGFPPAS